MEIPGPQSQLEAESLLKCCLRYLLVMLFNVCESTVLDTERLKPRKAAVTAYTPDKGEDCTRHSIVIPRSTPLQLE